MFRSDSSIDCAVYSIGTDDKSNRVSVGLLCGTSTLAACPDPGVAVLLIQPWHSDGRMSICIRF